MFLYLFRKWSFCFWVLANRASPQLASRWKSFIWMDLRRRSFWDTSLFYSRMQLKPSRVRHKMCWGKKSVGKLCFSLLLFLFPVLSLFLFNFGADFDAKKDSCECLWRARCPDWRSQRGTCWEGKKEEGEKKEKKEGLFVLILTKMSKIQVWEREFGWDCAVSRHGERA